MSIIGVKKMEILLLVFSFGSAALWLGYIMGYNKAAKDQDSTWLAAALRKTEIKHKTRG